MSEATLKVGKINRVLNVQPDPPDIRDRYYEPSLIRLQPELDENRFTELVLDQGQEGACTGFGLAAVINLLKRKSDANGFRASTRMLYEMAKKHDEWPGEKYEGSSCRGAIRGWHNMGVCEESHWPYKPGIPDSLLTVERAKEARKNTLGAYYRLRPMITDYHAALNETGAIFVSAKVHDGWSQPIPDNNNTLPYIEFVKRNQGGHAFAIVGYTSKGFIVQNSWSTGWGADGFAIWLYEDWIENIMDGWVFRMALPTPQIFGLQPHQVSTRQGFEEEEKGRTRRSHIAGHFVHFDDGFFKEKGTFWSTGEDIKQTACLLVKHQKYKHFLIYAHGGLNSPKDSAKRVRALKNGFKRNGIYPFHIMYDTGLAETIKDVVLNALGLAEKRAAGFTDFIDDLIEDVVRKPVTPLWDEMKNDARLPFVKKGDGLATLKIFLDELAKTNIEIHLVGHSTGGILLGHLLNALDEIGTKRQRVKSCSLMAPACSIDFYAENYEPRLEGKGGRRVPLPILNIYNLNEELEKNDNVANAYRKSLLYLVSRALERPAKEVKPLLGMQKYSKKLSKRSGLKVIYSNGTSGPTQSTTHGGFDNDENTMNNILTKILGNLPKIPFKNNELSTFWF